MNKKDKYIKLCEEEDIPVFLQYWWLDAVCGKECWDVVLVEKGGIVWGALPYYYIKTIVGLALVMPKLTQFIGPWIRYPQGQKYASRLSHEKEIMQRLIRKLPKYVVFKQNFHHSFTNWLPFYWEGFEQTTKYTYLISGGITKDVAWNMLSKDTRSRVRGAYSDLEITESNSLRTFFEINKLTFKRKEIDIPYSFEFLEKIDEAVRRNNSGAILVAKDSKDKIYAACYLIWDKKEVFYLAGGFDPELKTSGAMSLLIWKAIQLALDQGKSFNFEGSMLESVEKFFRGFGSRQKRYFRISKTKSLVLKVRYFIKSLL